MIQTAKEKARELEKIERKSNKKKERRNENMGGSGYHSNVRKLSKNRETYTSETKERSKKKKSLSN